jgi:hypothetical protein
MNERFAISRQVGILRQKSNALPPQKRLNTAYVRLQTKNGQSQKSSVVWTEESSDLTDEEGEESPINESDRELKEKFKILADIDEVNSSDGSNPNPFKGDMTDEEVERTSKFGDDRNLLGVSVNTLKNSEFSGLSPFTYSFQSKMQHSAYGKSKFQKQQSSKFSSHAKKSGKVRASRHEYDDRPFNSTSGTNNIQMK